MLLDAELALNSKTLQATRQIIEAYPAEFERRVESSILPDLDMEMHRWMHEPGEPVYPIDWTSDKQRRAYFATDGFGAGIPYRRTHELIDSWEVVQMWADGGFVIALESSAYAAQFVMGQYQQRFHYNTGWQNIRDIALVLSEQANDLLLQTWSFMLRDIAKGRIRS